MITLIPTTKKGKPRQIEILSVEKITETEGDLIIEGDLIVNGVESEITIVNEAEYDIQTDADYETNKLTDLIWYIFGIR